MPLVATAGVKVTNEHLSCLPRKGAILLHSLASSAVEEGFQSAIVFDKRTRVPASLGLPEITDAEDLTCFIQVSPCYQHFVKYRDAADDSKIVLTVQNYLDIYAFFNFKWPSVASKLLAYASDMRAGTDWVQLTKNLSFLSNGTCNYSATLGDDLILTASVDSRTAQSSGGDFTFVVAVAKNDRVLKLPLGTVTKMFGDIQGYKHIEKMYLTAVRTLAVSV